MGKTDCEKCSEKMDKRFDALEEKMKLDTYKTMGFAFIGLAFSYFGISITYLVSNMQTLAIAWLVLGLLECFVGGFLACLGIGMFKKTNE